MKLSQQQEGTLFLIAVSSFIWFYIGIKNNDFDIMLIIGSIIMGIVTTFVLVLIFCFMKATFKW